MFILAKTYKTLIEKIKKKKNKLYVFPNKYEHHDVVVVAVIYLSK